MISDSSEKKMIRLNITSAGWPNTKLSIAIKTPSEKATYVTRVPFKPDQLVALIFDHPHHLFGLGLDRMDDVDQDIREDIAEDVQDDRRSDHNSGQPEDLIGIQLALLEHRDQVEQVVPQNEQRADQEIR